MTSALLLLCWARYSTIIAGSSICSRVNLTDTGILSRALRLLVHAMVQGGRRGCWHRREYVVAKVLRISLATCKQSGSVLRPR